MKPACRNSILIIACAVFLSACEKANTPPEAIFSIVPEIGNTDHIFIFDATDCIDNEDAADDLKVRWDFESDGFWDIPFTTVKTFKHHYPVEGSYTISMEVIDLE